MAGTGASQLVDFDNTILKTMFADSRDLDGLGRLRVSTPNTVFDAQAQYFDDDLIWQNKITDTSGNASVTHLPNESVISLNVESNDAIIRQSRQYFRFQIGKSQLSMMTFVFSPPTTNLIQRVGYFDNENGVFFELNETTANLVIRSKVTGSVVENSVSQANWNLDTMDGNGPSGIAIDPTKAHVFVTDIQLIVGRVRVGFYVGGVIHYAHEFNHTNISDTVFITTANLPLRFEIAANGAVTGSHSLKVIGALVTSEGSFDETKGFSFAVSNGRVFKTLSGTDFQPLISIRPKQTFNGITNRGLIIPESYTIYSQDQSIAVQTFYGATLTGVVWQSADANSIVEYSVAATAMTGGVLISADYAAATSSGNTGGVIDKRITNKLPISLDIDGNQPTTPRTNIFTIAAVSLTTDTDVVAGINWKELR